MSDLPREIARVVRDAIQVSIEEVENELTQHTSGTNIQMMQVKGDDLVITFDNGYRAIMKVVIALPEA